MAMNMHTAGKKSDWEQVSPKKWNVWQKTAAATNGVVTPANIVSCLGAILVVVGFLQFGDGVTLTGLLYITVGRFADIVDGYIAHKTGTKSPFGEIVDTTVDKVMILFSLLIIALFNLIPALFTAAIIVQSFLNAGASLAGRRKGFVIHPSQYGKLATFLAWFTIISYLLHNFLRSKENLSVLSGVISALSYIAFVFFVLLAVHSTASYVNQLRTHKPHRSSK